MQCLTVLLILTKLKLTSESIIQNYINICFIFVSMATCLLFCRFVLVWDDEWEKLTNYFSYDVGVQVLQIKQDDGSFVLKTYPGD